MASGPGPVVQPRPQWEGMASKSGKDEEAQQVSTHRHSSGGNIPRYERGTSRKYGTLASEGLTGDTAVADTLGSGDETEETEKVETVDMYTGETYRHCAPPRTARQRRRSGGVGGHPSVLATRANPGDRRGYPGPTSCAHHVQLEGGGGGVPLSISTRSLFKAFRRGRGG